MSAKHAKLAGEGTALAAQKQHEGNTIPFMQPGITTSDRSMEYGGEVEIKNRSQLFLLNRLEEQESLEKNLEEKNENERRERQQKSISELIGNFNSFL